MTGGTIRILVDVNFLRFLKERIREEGGLVNFFFGYFYFLSRGKGTFCQTEEICANQRAGE